MAWSQLDLESSHIAYACVGIFCTLFSLVSLFVKEQLYIGEATVATIAGLILGPHCLNWFDPIDWGNHDRITLEISRIVLCIQIVAVAVELPKKYMKKHWLSVSIFLLPVMTIGWLIVGLFIWILMPHLSFSESLLISACITATDPVLAAAVVGKGKFAERVPGHLRNLLSAESGCNDGMAFPFIYLSLNLILHPGNGREIVKDWFLLTILWECLFGIVLGTFLGYAMRKLVAFAESHNLIDRESFLAIFIFLAFISAGVGSMLGVDDLLVSFAAGTAFGWNGDFAKKTEESHVSTVIDLILNLAYFVYLGAIVPWEQFNNVSIGLDVWRLIVLAFVIIFLRRLPAVVALKPFTPDVKTWREAIFCGHFGPIGVGAIFAVILARTDLEAHYTTEETPLRELPNEDFPHYLLLANMWPIVTFIVITSIVVHGSSVAVLTLGRRLNRMAITMTLTTNTTDNGNNWLSRLQKLDRNSTSFSLHRIDSDGTAVKSEKDEEFPRTNTVETSGIKVRPAGGARRKKHKRRHGPRAKIIRTMSHDQPEEEERQRPQAEFLQLGRTPVDDHKEEFDESTNTESPSTAHEKVQIEENPEDFARQISRDSVPTTAYQEGNKLIIEDENGEIVETVPVSKTKSRDSARESMSIHSMSSFRKHLNEFSRASEDNNDDVEDKDDDNTIDSQLARRGKSRKYYRKDDPKRKVFAHQIDNLIVIENEDGEIVRRYKVNRHASRPRTDSLLGKALGIVGLKSKEKAADPESGTTNVLVPDYTSKSAPSALDDPEVERSVEKKLTRTLLNSDARNATIPVPKSVPEESESEFDSEVSDDDNDDDDDDEDLLQETAIERQRRLAALGEVPATRNDDDEEE